jgi:hypothetical protein
VQFLPAVELEPDDSTYIQVMTCIVQPDPDTDTHTYRDIHPQLESDTGGWVAKGSSIREALSLIASSVESQPYMHPAVSCSIWTDSESMHEPWTEQTNHNRLLGPTSVCHISCMYVPQHSTQWSH